MSLLLSSLHLSPYSPHQPTPRQAAFLLLDDREALYGGAAGGGKSDALLMAALQYADVPGYAALILRRTFADLALPGAIMDRAKDWLGGRPGVRWNERDKTFTFPSGASLTFGYLETEADKYRYQGSELQFIGVDELTQFTELDYRYLFSRLRRTADTLVPLRMRAGSNPGGRGHAWVFQRFFVEGRAAGRIFVPARLTDNPHLDAASYIESLSELDPVTRKQLLDGDWTARQKGSKFRREWFSRVVDDRPAEARWCRYWDLASTEPRAGTDPDWTAGALMGRDRDGMTYMADMRRERGTPSTIEKLIASVAETDPPGTSIRMEQEPGSSGVALIDHYSRRILYGRDFRGIRSTGDKEVRANPLAAAAEVGNVVLVRGAWLGDFLDEAEAFPLGSHDDQVDAASGAFAFLARVFITGASGDVSPAPQPDRNPYHADRRSILGGRRR